MELNDFVRVVRAHWVSLLTLALIGMLLAALWTALQPKVYAANATGLVTAGPTEDRGLQSLGDSLSKSRVKSYVVLAKDRTTAQKVIDALDLDTDPGALASQISVEQPVDTVYITVTARSTSPDEAQELADAWVDALAERVAEIETPKGTDPGAGLHIEASASAIKPTTPVSPRPELNLALGLMAGLGVGFTYALLRQRLDRRLRTPDAVERDFGITVVGTIPDTAELSRDESGLAPIVVTTQTSLAAEAFRKIRTNLAFMDVDNPPRVVVMTSPHQSDGKSTLAANIAAAIAVSGQPIILIDGDLRRPTVAKSFGLAEGVGLTDVLVGRLTVADVLQPHASIPGLSVMAAGSRPPNPSELLGSRAMHTLLDELSRDAMVIVDAPPLLPVTDAAVVTGISDGALVTISAGKTLDTDLEQALNNLAAVQGRVLGVVFNRMSKKASQGAAYYYDEYSYAYGLNDRRNGGARKRVDPKRSPGGRRS